MVCCTFLNTVCSFLPFSQMPLFLPVLLPLLTILPYLSSSISVSLHFPSLIPKNKAKYQSEGSIQECFSNCVLWPMSVYVINLVGCNQHFKMKKKKKKISENIMYRKAITFSWNKQEGTGSHVKCILYCDSSSKMFEKHDYKAY